MQLLELLITPRIDWLHLLVRIEEIVHGTRIHEWWRDLEYSIAILRNRLRTGFNR